MTVGLTLFESAAAVPATCVRTLTLSSLYNTEPCRDCCAVPTYCPTTGSNYYVRILSTLNRELLKPSSSVALHRHSNALVDILPPEADSSISLLGDNEKPNVTYQVGVEIGVGHCPQS